MGTAGKERVGPVEREALNVYITVCKIRQPAEGGPITQGAQIRCSVITQRGGMRWEARGRFKREGSMYTYG